MRKLIGVLLPVLSVIASWSASSFADEIRPTQLDNGQDGMYNIRFRGKIDMTTSFGLCIVDNIVKWNGKAVILMEYRLPLPTLAEVNLPDITGISEHGYIYTLSPLHSAGV
jgi:hypothetical protein